VVDLTEDEPDLAVERDRAHRLPRSRPRDEHGQRHHQRRRRDDRQDPRDRDVQRALVDALDRVDQVERLVAAEVPREEEQRAVLEEERDAERADQRCDSRRVPERPVREALDRNPEDAGAEHRHEEHQGDQQPDRDHRIERAAERGQDAVADEGADHEHVAVGEVQQLEDPVDQRVAQGDQGVHAPERHAVDGELDEDVPVDREDHGARLKHVRPAARRRAGRKSLLQARYWMNCAFPLTTLKR
jgi:hypothetical protein